MESCFMPFREAERKVARSLKADKFLNPNRPVNIYRVRPLFLSQDPRRQVTALKYHEALVPPTLCWQSDSMIGKGMSINLFSLSAVEIKQNI
eukprot:scaffold165_cov106-Skeletonema_dohrnii-CCMP3373.AAC.5